MVNGEHSYAIAWSSKRIDGAPFTVSANIASLELTNANGYRVTVSVATEKLNKFLNFCLFLI